jgi:glycosyltransferase involved in cell wall biosynthesis
VKVAYIVTRADPLGGVQIHIRDLAAALQERGHSVIVITSGHGPFLDQLHAQSTPVVLLRNLTFPISPVRDFRALLEIRAKIRELSPDLVAAHSSKAGILSRIAGASLGTPVVLTAHGWNFSPGIPRLEAGVYRQFERLVGRFTTRIITVSECDRRLALEAGLVSEDRVTTVHNGMPDVSPTMRADPSLDPPRLVMVARLGAQKDHGTLLRALAGLKARAWELDLVGDGPLMAETQSLARTLGVDSRVRFLGQRHDVHHILATAQMSVLATKWEGLPLSILEAMRAGLPVVATAAGGIDEAVQDQETGYVVPRGDVEALRDRIERLLTNSALRVRFGAAGRTRYEQRFTLDTFVTNTLAVYQDIVQQGSARRTR